MAIKHHFEAQFQGTPLALLKKCYSGWSPTDNFTTVSDISSGTKYGTSIRTKFPQLETVFWVLFWLSLFGNFIFCTCQIWFSLWLSFSLSSFLFVTFSFLLSNLLSGVPVHFLCYCSFIVFAFFPWMSLMFAHDFLCFAHCMSCFFVGTFMSTCVFHHLECVFLMLFSVLIEFSMLAWL